MRDTEPVQIHTPEGTIGQMPVTGAAPISVLSGAKIGLLDNRKPNADIVLGHIADRLTARTGAEVVRRDHKRCAIFPTPHELRRQFFLTMCRRPLAL